MFEIKNVTKVFKNEKALSNVSFKINGGMNFIIGASGSGKTTLLRILSGLDKEYEGEVFYNSNSIKKLSQKEKIRYYGSEFGFNTWIGDICFKNNVKVYETLINKEFLTFQ